jgi:hypothetical protein
MYQFQYKKRLLLYHLGSMGIFALTSNVKSGNIAFILQFIVMGVLESFAGKSLVNREEKILSNGGGL